MKSRRISSFLLSLLLAALSAGLMPQKAAAAGLIGTRSEFLRALGAAQDGDTLVVGNIDFSVSNVNGAYNQLERITISKSITIRSGLSGKAVLTRACFLISGGKQSGISVTLENLTFDGGVDADALTAADWQPNEAANSPEPEKAQFALSASGNGEICCLGCVFQNYMHAEGSAIRCFYGDYREDPDSLRLYGDNSGCALRLNLTDCVFQNNASLYTGGALHLEGCRRNVTLEAENCQFLRNRCGITADGQGFLGGGGGAAFLQDASVTLRGCQLLQNTADHIYSGDTPFSDNTNGGALFLEACEADVQDCVFTDNRACLGGALYIGVTNASLTRCVIAGNRAASSVPTGDNKGPWSDMEMGGGIFCSNYAEHRLYMEGCTVRLNTAANAYGGLLAKTMPEPFGSGAVEMVLCTYADNMQETVFTYPGQFPGFDVPDDIWSYPHISALGCLIADSSFASDFPRFALPSAENGYTAFAPPEKAQTGGWYDPDTPLSEPLCCLDSHMTVSLPDKSGTAVIGAPPKVSAAATPKTALFGVLTMALMLAGVLLLCRPQKAPAPSAAEAPAQPALTPREQDILAGLLGGKTRKVIAQELYLSESTVKKYAGSIYEKYGVSSRVELMSKLKNE